MWNAVNSDTQFFIRLCSDRAAYEVRPNLRVHFTMNYLKQVLEKTKNYDLIVYTPHITIVRSCEGTEVTIFKDGRMIIKEVSSESEARTIAGEVLKMLSKALTR